MLKVQTSKVVRIIEDANGMSINLSTYQNPPPYGSSQNASKILQNQWQANYSESPNYGYPDQNAPQQNQSSIYAGYSPQFNSNIVRSGGNDSSIPISYPTNANAMIVHNAIQPKINQDQDHDQEMISLENFDVRIAFIRKVYGILSVQMAITVFFCFYSMSNVAFQTFQQQHGGILILAFAINIVTCFTIACYPSVAKQVPLNYFLLFIFTLSEAYIVSSICSSYSQAIVFEAAVITLLITIALTIYACVTKSDFTMEGGAIFVFSTTMFFAGFFLIFCHSKILQIIYCCIWAMIYGFYIIYDTNLIVGKGKYALSVDDYIFASLMLYVDIMGLFLQILEVLGASQN